jgi:hypothetical protein
MSLIAKILAPDKETLERTLNGCAHYGLNAKHNKRTDPYVHIEIGSDEDAEHLFWLGANLATPKVNTSRCKSSF